MGKSGSAPGDRSLVPLAVGNFLLLFLATWMYPLIWPHLTPVVTLRDGQIQGKVAYSRDGMEYWQFLSIPYAQPPLGSLKFQPPLPVKPWVGVKQAVNNPPLCVQIETVVSRNTFGQEDCLYLNVFAPPFKETNSEKLPVLVDIHGGAFIFGGSSVFGPDYIMDHPLVLVSFNYRLGPFGFLNFEHDPATDGVHLPRGNVGMKDQLMVLRWVQQNIARFGGDPQRVTLMGESAGGISVHLHILSEKSRGLFHRAFVQSGSALCVWGWTSQPRKVAMEYARRIGCPVNDTRALLNCLENYDPWEMTKFQLITSDPGVVKDNLSPSVETVESEDLFLDAHPQDIMDSGKFSKLPLILGVNAAEGILRTGRFSALPERLEMLRQNWTESLESAILVDDLTPSTANAIRRFYIKGNEKDDSVFKGELHQLFNDLVAYEPVERAARGHVREGGGPTRLFYFNYTSRWGPGSHTIFSSYRPDSWWNGWVQLAWKLGKDWMADHVWGGQGMRPYGVAHGEELYQLWNMFGICKYFTGADYNFSKEFVRLIADFAQEKDPPQFKGTKWPELKFENNVMSPTYMLLDNSPVANTIQDPFQKAMEFWNSVDVKEFNKGTPNRNKMRV